MAVRNKTPFIADEIYFITFTIAGWKKVFTSDEYCQLVCKWFDYAKENYANCIYGYVIMPNHVHVLMHLTDKSPILAKLIFSAKKFLAFGIRNLLIRDKQINLLNFFADKKTKAKASYRIFEPRYDSLIIQSEKFFREKLNYIHNNPCQEKWNLAEKPEDYKYSSASNYINGEGYYEIEVMEF